jgi:hypothetical protein
MKKPATLEELIKEYLKGDEKLGSADSYDVFKHKNGLSNAKSYSDAVGSLYASSKRSLSSYGANNRELSNKGLQNSGYSSYVDYLSDSTFKTGLESLKKAYSDKEASARASYASYLDKYKDKTASVKKSVMSHLIGNDVVDLNTAIAYGISAGLSKEDATLVGQTAYEVTKQKVFNTLLEQTVSLGLDADGAKMLAIKMGVSDEDASAFASEISELLEYYGNISEDYLEFLEQRSH